MKKYTSLTVAAIAVAVVGVFAMLPAFVQAQDPAATPPVAASTPVAVPSARPMGFEDLAEKLAPAVVNISTTTKIEPASPGDMPQMPALPPGSPFEQFFKDFYDFQQQQGPNAAPSDEKAFSLGSGFVIDAQAGYIVTNNHVIKDADEIKVILNDNTNLDATLVGTDEKTDIALLKVKPGSAPLKAVTWGDSDSARVGSWVLAIGNPFGLGGTITAGIISARHRDINTGPYDEYIQTDASINRGNSGGPMFNMSGEVIGVNTAIYSPSGGSVGIGFAVPSNMAKSVVEQLIRYGKTKRGWLGVKIQEVTPEIAESIGLSKAQGAMVSSVTPEGPAAKAGVLAGDVIIKFEGQAIDKMNQLPRMVAAAEVGKKTKITVWRKGKEQEIAVDLGQLEKAEEDGLLAGKPEVVPGQVKALKVEALGLSVTALDDNLRAQYKLPATAKGVLVAVVEKGSAAAEKGITVGDAILEIDQSEAGSPEQFVEKVKAAVASGRGSALLFVAKRDDMRFVALKLKK